MTSDLAKILKSKCEFRQRLASRPIEEKLAMLDALRERALAIPQGGARRQAMCYAKSRRRIATNEHGW